MKPQARVALTPIDYYHVTRPSHSADRRAIAEHGTRLTCADPDGRLEEAPRVFLPLTGLSRLFPENYALLVINQPQGRLYILDRVEPQLVFRGTPETVLETWDLLRGSGELDVDKDLLPLGFIPWK